jgi:hypothetical protein
MLLFIIIFWAFFVLNTELVIHWNQPTQTGSGTNWQFGQVRIIVCVDLYLNCFTSGLDFANVLDGLAAHQHDQRFQPIRDQANQTGLSASEGFRHI